MRGGQLAYRNQLGTGCGYDMRLVGSWIGCLNERRRKGENSSDKYEARTMEDLQFNKKRKTRWERYPRVLRVSRPSLQ